jgi:cyanate permease
LKSGAFWRISVAFGILMFTISTVAIFRVPHFIEQGVEARWVALAFSAEALVSAAVALPIGLLLERFRTHHLAAAAFTFPIWMLLLTINADTRWEVFASTMTFGMGAASVMIIQNTIWPAYFGAQNIGAIRGAAMPITLGFAVLGAPVAGIVKDLTGSFVPLWWATFAAMLVAIVLIACTPVPKPPDTPADET